MKPAHKFMSIVGARPQFVKAFPFSRRVRNHSQVREVLVHTGQHYDFEMSRVFFEELEIPEPDYHLEAGSGSHSEQTARILDRLEKVLVEEAPDLVIVYGDTNSTLAGALAAAKQHIPVVHIEAGLRSYNRSMPEEINRVVADHLSSGLFCPTKTAVENLRREGIENFCETVGEQVLSADHPLVFHVQDIMEEALLLALPQAENKIELLATLGIQRGHYLLATVHRAENIDDPDRFRAIMNLLSEVSCFLPMIFPLHPRARKQVETLGVSLLGSVHIVKPVGYLQMLALERNAYAILTDSGGVQKEAFWLGVPCLTLRRETEWLETLAEGRNRLVDVDKDKVLSALRSAREVPLEVKPSEASSSKEMLFILEQLTGNRSPI